MTVNRWHRIKSTLSRLWRFIRSFWSQLPEAPATVNRWHNNASAALRNSGDTIDMHQRRVARMCAQLAAHLGLTLDGSDLPDAALHHDEAERVIGDMPGPAKDAFPALARAYAAAERIVLHEMGLGPWRLSDEEAAILHICDRLDAILWAAKCGVTGPEWDEAIAKVEAKATTLSPAALAWVRAHLAWQDVA